MSEWISAKDRLPRDDERVVVIGINVEISEEEYSIGYHRRGFGWYFPFGSGVCIPCFFKHLDKNTAIVTHWMPLPEPPEVIPDD